MSRISDPGAKPINSKPFSVYVCWGSRGGVSSLGPLGCRVPSSLARHGVPETGVCGFHHHADARQMQGRGPFGVDGSFILGLGFRGLGFRGLGFRI